MTDDAERPKEFQLAPILQEPMSEDKWLEALRSGEHEFWRGWDAAFTQMAQSATPPTTDDVERARGDNGLTQAARTLLTKLQSIMLGDEATPDPKSMTAIYTTLSAAREEGAREMRERALAVVREMDDDQRTPDWHAAIKAAQYAIRALPESNR